MIDNFAEVDLVAIDKLVHDLFKTMGLKNGTALLKAIKEKGTDINVADSYGRTLLIQAVEFVAIHKTTELRKKIVANILVLLKNGADVNRNDVRDETAFSLALKLQQKDLIKTLFKHGADFPSRIN